MSIFRLLPQRLGRVITALPEKSVTSGKLHPSGKLHLGCPPPKKIFFLATLLNYSLLKNFGLITD